MIIFYAFLLWLLQNTKMPYITRKISNLIFIVIPIYVGVSLTEIYGENIIKIVVNSLCLVKDRKKYLFLAALNC